MPAREVHVCGNGSAVDLVQRLASLMNEQLEVSATPAMFRSNTQICMMSHAKSCQEYNTLAYADIYFHPYHYLPVLRLSATIGWYPLRWMRVALMVTTVQ